MEKEYLGDGVYAAVDRFGEIRLTTEDGIVATNTIYLEPEVVECLLDYMARVKEERKPSDRSRTESVPVGRDGNL